METQLWGSNAVVGSCSSGALYLISRADNAWEKAVGGAAVSLGGNYFTGSWIFAVVANLSSEGGSGSWQQPEVNQNTVGWMCWKTRSLKAKGLSAVRENGRVGTLEDPEKQPKVQKTWSELTFSNSGY